jgi:hypothetical protein
LWEPVDKEFDKMGTVFNSSSWWTVTNKKIIDLTFDYKMWFEMLSVSVGKNF